MMDWLICVGCVIALSACGGEPKAPAATDAPAPAATAAPATAAPATDEPAATTRAGVKPHYVKCDPARPELPCTPDLPKLKVP